MKFNANLTLIPEARFLNAQNIFIIGVVSSKGSTEQRKSIFYKQNSAARSMAKTICDTHAHRIRYNMPQCHQTPCAREIQFKTLSKTHNSWKFIIIAIITT